MSRFARPVLPAIAVLAASVVLPIVSTNNPAGAADACLTAPNTPAPRGSHWYYRIERPSLRKCWRLVQKDTQDQRATAAVTQPEPDAAEPAMPASEPAERAAETAAPPVIRTLVTRNVSNTSETVEPPPAPSPAPSAPIATAPAPMQADAPASPAAQPLPTTATDMTAAVPGLRLLLQAIALLGLLAAAAIGLLLIVRRRTDVLDTVRETDAAPFDALPATAIPPRRTRMRA